MQIFGLADCNNFYCSCERLFQPKLNGKPVVVLSNNDGCVIARSEQAKKLGIKMGTPEFMIRPLLKEHKVEVFSSNYTLYGDMSARVMQTLSLFTPALEIYSIDEAFLDLSHVRGLEDYAKGVRETVLLYTGIPIGVGLARTKTLAKAANRLSKKIPSTSGVLNFVDNPNVDSLLAQLPCEDVWGIGRQNAKLLRANRIVNALQLKHAPLPWIRRHMGVVGERLVMELNGISCLRLEEVQQPRQNIVCAKSFGHPVTDKDEASEALASYISRAAEKLRAQEMVATAIHVFLLTNSHKAEEPQYCGQITRELPEPTDYTPELIAVATELLNRIYKNGYSYRKVGIMLCGLVSRKEVQLDLFSGISNPEQKAEISRVLDGINRRFGRNTVHSGAMGFRGSWKARTRRKSPCYTTRWSDLVVVKC